MEEEKPVDHEDREKARLLLDENIVVSAGAGTGKTTLLVDRIVYLILTRFKDEKELDLSRLVALTFTEKAAGEIRDRVAGRLSAVLRETDAGIEGAFLRTLRERFAVGPAKARPILLKAIETLDQAQIGTIHSFASFLLKLYPLEAGVDPGFEVDEGDAFDRLFEEDWSRWIEGELGECPADADAAKRWRERRPRWLEILRAVSLPDIRGLARAMASDDVEWSPGRDPGGSVRETIARTAKDLAARAEALETRPDGTRYSDAEKILKVCALAEEAAASEAREIPRRIELPHFGGGMSLGKIARNWTLSEDDWDGMKKRYGLLKRVAARSSPAVERLFRLSMGLLSEFVLDFRRHYYAAGNIGMHGLLTRARDLVLKDREVRRELKRRFVAILIDEFQDTDPAQGEILLMLGEKEGSFAAGYAKADFEPGKLFVVGDPKQSIYRFRGADMAAYERYTRALLKKGAVSCSLTANFRSHAGVLDPVNRIFPDKIMRPREGVQPGYEAIHPRPASRPARHTGVELVCLRSGAPDEKLSADAGRADEAAWITGWIEAHCRPRAGEEELPRGVFNFGEIAVLLRSGTALTTYVDALKARAIPYVVEADRYFYHTPEIVDFLNILRVVDDPADRISLTGLLRSPLVGLPDAELVRLLRTDKLKGYFDKEAPQKGGLLKDNAERVRRFFALLAEIRGEVGRRPLGELVSRILSRTFLLELCSSAYQGDQTLSNLWKLARMAADAGGGRGLTLKEFVADIETMTREEKREGESPLADDTLDAVRIMTIHKSKGLEFPVVILPNLSAGTRGGGEDAPFKIDWSSATVGYAMPGAKLCDLAMGWIALREEERERAEAVRLLYVAMTRAKEHAILLCNADTSAPDSFTKMLQLGGLWPADAAAGSVDLGAGVAVPAAQPSGPLVPPAEKGAAAGRTALDARALGETWQKRHEVCGRLLKQSVFVSPAALAAEDQADGRWAESEEARTRRDFKSLVGIACHRVLERWDFAGGRPLPGHGTELGELLGTACAELLRANPGMPAKRVAEASLDLLDGFLASPAAGTLAGCEILARELPVVSPLDGRVVRGYVDVVYRDKKSGVLYAGDYKTADVPKSKLQETADGYRAQGGAYAAALTRALGSGCRASVIFLAAGEIIDFSA